MEEGRRRQLLGIADDHRLFGARQRRDGLFRPHLRRLVDDHQVEPLVRLQELRHRRGGHHRAGFHGADGVRGPVYEVAQWDVLFLLGDLVAHQCRLGTFSLPGRLDALWDGRGGQGSDEIEAAHVHDTLVKVLEAPTDVVQRERMGLAELGVQLHDPAGQGAVEHPVVGFD